MARIHADQAKALVGTRFRPQGHEPGQGLDCLGLCLAAFRLPACLARDDYRLRGDHRGELKRGIKQHFRRVSRNQRRAGDLLLLAVTRDQLHLAIQTEQGFVHADAGLRRVVETPGQPGWPLIGVYRRRREKKG